MRVHAPLALALPLSLITSQLLLCGFSSAQPVVLKAPVTNFAPNALGGILSIVRFAVARPDKHEIDYLLLGAASGEPDTSAPTAIQVEGEHGDDITLSDVYGADCVLARTAIVRMNDRVVLIRATRADDVPHVMAGSLAQPGPMNIRFYRSHPGGDAGQSSPIFVSDGRTIQTKPVCSETEISQVIDQAIRIPEAPGVAR